MARREVLEVTCDRCDRTETQPKVDRPQLGPELKISFLGEEVVYEDLCTRCRGAVSNYFDSLTKSKDPPSKEPEAKTGLFGGKKS